ncbi:TonB-dependent receptor domain-containing protein [Granulicella cerasi]|uniref:TonB-dependent receptor domain-containing protein n=1 Tax=Granulicella cerasi TaxID=741063 RepID=A0ABW1Z675_9BACT
MAFLNFLRVAASLAIAATAVQAQQAVPLRGILVDPSGAPVVGVSLELSSSDGQVRAQATSAANGEFSLGSIIPGSYVVSVPAANGLAAQTRSLEIKNNISALRLVLVPETVTQTVNVDAGRPLSTEASANHDSVAVQSSALDHLPVFDQNIVGALTPFLDPAATSSSGTSIIVDGMEMVNGVNVSPSAIAEVRINSDPYSAEFASPGRGRLEITTKPGSPQYHGTFNFIARDAVFNATNYFAPVRPPEQRRIYEGHFTGPVGHGGHSTILLTGTRQEDDLQTAIHAVGPRGLVAENSPTPSRSNQITGRVSHDFSDAHRVAVSYNFRYNTIDGYLVGGVVLPEAGLNSANRQDQIVFNDRVIVTPNLVQQVQLLLERETDSEKSITNAQSIQVQEAFTGGGAQGDTYRTENTIGLIDVVAWTHRKHYVRFGVNVPQISRRAVDDHSNRLGIFAFNSLSDYAAAKPYSFTVQQGAGRATYFATEIGTFVQDEISLRGNLQVTVGLRYQWQTYLTSTGNFAPRVSLAYAPAKKWVLRAGSGIFYDRTGGDFLVTFKLHNGTVLRQYQILDPSYPNALPAGTNLSQLPTSIVREQPGMRAAYQVQYSGTVERQLGSGLTASATYRGITGIDVFRSRDANAPLPPYTTMRPDTSVGFVQQVEAGGRSRLNALDLGLHGKVGIWFQGQAQYTFSHSENNTGGLNWYPQNQYAPNDEWGRADLDRRHRFNLLASIYPGHWLSLGLAAAVYSGTPYTELAGTDLYDTGLGNARPSGVARNTLQGSGTTTLDLLWDHDFHLDHRKGEQAKILNLGVSGFNVLNHANFSNFIGNVRSPLYKQATTALPARQLQFSLRYQF